MWCPAKDWNRSNSVSKDGASGALALSAGDPAAAFWVWCADPASIFAAFLHLLRGLTVVWMDC